MNGILLFNKPKDISSFKAIRKVQAILNLKKVGHCGTLDPLATGMLPIMINEGTKYSQYIISNDKAYTVELRLGFISDTYDIEGNIEQVLPSKKIELDDIKALLKKFTGTQSQLPPKYSALKVNGKRAYELARKGIDFELKKRTIKISKIELLESTNQHINLYIECSKGTYIRTLVHDIGQQLGCGAIMTKLHRNWVAPFQNSISYDYNSLEECQIIPIESIFNQSITLDEISTKAIIYGQSINVKQQIKHEHLETIAIFNNNKKFIGIGEIEEYILKPKRLLANLHDQGCK
ncbi:MAG: tRNA pseudouridine(55) synthase TruB [Gammaproteobacteria bacterium]|nr:tRNA pseudouridine(55) synthase TruB [Gammaproteobacteria bacterium]